MSGKELQRLRKKNVQLEEENNLLKLKIEILLDMVITNTQCGLFDARNISNLCYCYTLARTLTKGLVTNEPY